MMTENPLLRVAELNIFFHGIPVVSGLSFEVKRGEILALVGESGCGKSISCLSLTHLLPEPPAKVQAGKIEFDGLDLTHPAGRVLRRIRGGRIAYIFQEPSASLNPVMRVGAQIAEVLQLHRPEIRDRRAETIRLLEQVGIPAPDERINAFPHELSGGMQQRIMIAMALAGNPDLLIADEPTTALDVTIQAQILELIDRLRRERNMAVILVTHNLGIVGSFADRVCVMYAGRIAERGTVRSIIDSPRHPYTRALLAAVPRLGSPEGVRLATIPGHVPPPADFPAGCRFAPRCVSADERCRCEVPPEVDGCACFHPDPGVGK